MRDETFEELQELGVQILITALLAISSVLVQSAINKIRYGHISNVPPRNNYRQPIRYPKKKEVDDDNFFLNLGDDDEDDDYDSAWHK